MTDPTSFGPGSNTGHGHVWKRPDGVKARCGGPGLCVECSKDQARWQTMKMTDPTHSLAEIMRRTFNPKESGS